MLLSLLFDQRDQLVAAALACDQQPLGDRYWHEVYPQRLGLSGCQSAVMNIEDQALGHRLLELAKDASGLPHCRNALEAYERGQVPGRPSRSRAA